MAAAEFRRRRQRARLAAIGLGLGLIAVTLLRDQVEAQSVATVVTVLCLLALRIVWRCPGCGRPPAALPWGEPEQCRRCGAAFREAR